MGPSRLPRFRRIPDPPPLEITPRDGEIVQLVGHYRFLRSSQITSFVAGSRQQILRRLQLLYHHGYLERPRAQLDYYHRGGSRSIIYGLGNKGAKLLSGNRAPMDGVRWGEKNRSVGRQYLEHAVRVSDVMVAIENACRHQGIAFSDNLAETRWRVKMTGDQIGVVPDRVFTLEWTDEHGIKTKALYCLEVDRGTMPVTRSNLHQTSMLRKFRAYQATWSQGVPRRLFGVARMRVLIVTTGADRLQSLCDAVNELKSGKGLFLFADQTVSESPDILGESWKTANGEETTLLA